jgi:hypothetical protein
MAMALTGEPSESFIFNGKARKVKKSLLISSKLVRFSMIRILLDKRILWA